MKPSITPDEVVIFPRLKHKDILQRLISTHLPDAYSVAIADPQRMPHVIMHDERLRTLFQRNANTLVLLEAPVVGDLAYTWRQLMYDIRILLGKNLQSAMIIDTQWTHTKRLTRDIGIRLDHVAGRDIDPNFHDTVGPERLMAEVRNRMPEMHLIQTAEARFVEDVSQCLATFSEGRQLVHKDTTHLTAA